jgi:hypothetical protein
VLKYDRVAIAHFGVCHPLAIDVDEFLLGSRIRAQLLLLVSHIVEGTTDLS